MKCAFYEKEITPPLGCRIPGYFNVRLASGVKDRLFAKALVIQGDDTVAIVGTDLIHFPLDVREAVVKRIREYADISADNILLSSNHTHTGGPISPTPAPDSIRDDGYTDMLIRSIADGVVLAYQRLEDSNLSFGIGEVKGISFNRNYIIKDSTPTTNPGRKRTDILGPLAEIDYELPVLFIKDATGKPTGALTCFACHQDCVGGTEYNGDYSSVLSAELKKKYGNDFVSVFMAGTCGNINHIDVSREDDAPDHYIKMGKALAEEAIRVIEKSDPVLGDTIAGRLGMLTIDRAYIDPSVIKNAEHIVETIPEKKGIKIAADATEKGQYDLAMSKSLLKFISQGDKYDVPVQVIRICDIGVYALAGEVFCQFGMEIKDKSPAARNIVATNSNAAIGYVPTEDSFYPTIYESKPGANKISKTGGRLIANEALRLAAEIF